MNMHQVFGVMQSYKKTDHKVKIVMSEKLSQVTN